MMMEPALDNEDRGEVESILKIGFPSFPRRLYFKQAGSQELSINLKEKLRFYYSILTSTRDVDMLCQVSRLFIQCVSKEEVQLPEWLEGRFCTSCQCFGVPGVTFTTRLRPRSKRSPCNNKGNKRRSVNAASKEFSPLIKNELVSDDIPVY